MKAIVFNQYGQPDVLLLEEVKKPSPRNNEVLIKVHAVSLNYADWHMLTGKPFVARLSFGLFRPMKNILGADIAGVVEAIGPGITRFKPGDEVYGDLGMVGFGGLAEYVCAPEHVIATKPTNLTYEESAALPMASVTALQALQNDGQVQPGQEVLIHGSAGGVGTFAIQIAKYLGAEVTGVCSTRNIEQTLALGADHVIDYLKEDFAANGKTYDLILGINGNRSIFDYRKALAPNGKYLMIGGSDKQIFQFMLLGPFIARPGQKMGSVFAKTLSKELIAIKDLAEAGKIRPLIDRTYKLAETPEAMRYLGTGHARAKIIIKIVP
ncbi:MAG: NAD(P)-dependent alcohol dehydrogenase [Leptolinea sp.]|nr:NAD(P)-dependent alcohol dehydrogenase [Leptolinea sp.]